MSLVISEEVCEDCEGKGEYLYHHGGGPPITLHCKSCLATGRKLITLEQALKSLGFHMPGDVILLNTQGQSSSSEKYPIPGFIICDERTKQQYEAELTHEDETSVSLRFKLDGISQVMYFYKKTGLSTSFPTYRYGWKGIKTNDL